MARSAARATIVLRLRDGLIIDMQDYASSSRALWALRRPTLPLFGRAG
jgi:hypothetical protein